MWHRQLDVDTMANVEPYDRRRPILAVRLLSLDTLAPLLISYIIVKKLYSGTEFSLEAWLLTPLLVASVHGATRVVNVSYDYDSGEIIGRDNNDRLPACRTDHQVKWLSAVLYSLGCITFFLLVAISPANTSRLGLYLLVLSTSFVHTSGLGPKYLGLADMVFLVCVPISYLFGCFSPRNEPDFMFFAITCILKIESMVQKYNADNLENDRGAVIRLAKEIIDQIAVYTIFHIFSTLFSGKLLLTLLVQFIYAIKIETELKSSIYWECVFTQPSKLNFIFGTLFVLVIFVVFIFHELDK